MNRYRILSAAAVVVLGVIYAVVGTPSLPYVLPLMCLCFLAICIFSIWEARKTGLRGFSAVLPALASGLAALTAAFGTLVFFLQRR